MLFNTKRIVKAFIRTAKQEIIMWPTPEYFCNDRDYFFLFILTPPYSGSTALAQVLNSAKESMILNERAEGQWLIPGLCQKDRWKPTKQVQWESVKATWLSQVNMIERLVGKIDVIIEKSPPHIVRADQLADTFPYSKFITFNRNPYANCASILYRHHNPAQKTEKKRILILQGLARDWIARSIWIKKWIDTLQTINLTYEQFCNDPKSQIQLVADALPSFTGVDVNQQLKIKDYPTQNISNQNRRQIANLSDQEKLAISRELSAHEQLLNFFGYTSLWEKNIEEGGARNGS